MKTDNKNDKAWNQIFDSLPIMNEIESCGHYDISAKDIKLFGSREPRLMCKIDNRNMLPYVMKRRSLGILAIRNGLYRIAKFDPFIDVNLRASGRNQPTVLAMPKHIMSLESGRLTSESAVLDAAKASGILEMMFGEEVDLTIRGRCYSPSFDLTIDNNKFEVSGVQVEIDGGYEGENYLNLVETKMEIPRTISLRQIAYPHLMWEQKLATRKEVRSFVCFYVAPTLHFVRAMHQYGKWILDAKSERKFNI